MDNLKIAEMLFKLQMDDIRDAEMLADYAAKISDLGDQSIGAAIYTRAKARLNQSMECERTIKTVMDRVKAEKAAEGMDYDVNNIYADMYNSYIEGWTDKVRRKLEAM